MSFTLPLLRGGSLTLSSLRGRPVLITLFSTWDMRCQAEVPLINQLKERYGPRGLEVLGVALAPPGNKSLTLIKTYVEVTRITYDVLLAEPQDLELVGALGQTRRVPRTVLLDHKGRVLLDQAGQTDFLALRSRIERELGIANPLGPAAPAGPLRAFGPSRPAASLRLAMFFAWLRQAKAGAATAPRRGYVRSMIHS